MKDLKELGFDFSENDPHEVLDSVWFGLQNYGIGPARNLPVGATIGIISTRDPVTKKKLCYIGIGNGREQSVDEYFIIKTGAKFDQRWLKPDSFIIEVYQDEEI